MTPTLQDPIPKVDHEQARIGKSYAVFFDREYCNSSNPFIKILQTPNFREGRPLKAKDPFTFKIENIVRDEENGVNTYYQIALPDSSRGYMRIIYFRVDEGQSEWSIQNGCLFEGSVDEWIAKSEAINERKRTEQAEVDAARKLERDERERRQRMPGARIGMTAQQVIDKTNWGIPDSINRTVTGTDISEQWVYGHRSYLYFRNGRLASIQTSQ